MGGRESRWREVGREEIQMRRGMWRMGRKWPLMWGLTWAVLKGLMSCSSRKGRNRTSLKKVLPRRKWKRVGRVQRRSSWKEMEGQRMENVKGRQHQKVKSRQHQTLVSRNGWRKGIQIQTLLMPMGQVRSSRVGSRRGKKEAVSWQRGIWGMGNSRRKMRMMVPRFLKVQMRVSQVIMKSRRLTLCSSQATSTMQKTIGRKKESSMQRQLMQASAAAASALHLLGMTSTIAGMRALVAKAWTNRMEVQQGLLQLVWELLLLLLLVGLHSKLAAG
jgi:hypothetical protein